MRCQASSLDSPLNWPGVDHDARVDVGRVAGQLLGRHVVGRVRRSHDHPNRQIECARELPVTLVRGRHGHDGASAVLRQHVVGNPYRQPLAVGRIDGVAPDEDASLRALGRHAFDLRRPPTLVDVALDFGLPIGSRQLLDQRVLRRQHDVRHAEDGVDACGEDGDLRVRALVDRQVELDAFRSTDPVRLHRLDAVGPVDLAEVEQVVGILGDAEEPLLEVALRDGRITPPAAAVVDLLIGQHAVVRAPVDGRLVPIGEAALVELQKEPLIPVVVRRLARGELLGPVVRTAHRPPLDFHAADVLHGPRVRMRAALDGGALGGQPERVEARRKQGGEALHALVAHVHIGQREVPPVAQVQVTAGVRKHHQRVVLGFVGIDLGAVQAIGFPASLPLWLDRGMLERARHNLGIVWNAAWSTTPTRFSLAAAPPAASGSTVARVALADARERSRRRSTCRRTASCASCAIERAAAARP